MLSFLEADAQVAGCALQELLQLGSALIGTVVLLRLRCWLLQRPCWAAPPSKWYCMAPVVVQIM